MEQKIMFLLFIKILGFILLGSIYHFYNDKISLNKLMNENCKIFRRFDTRNYRLLSKYKQNKDSDMLGLNDIPINGKPNKGKIKHSTRSSLNKAQYYTEVIDYINGMFDGKHFHFEKKLIKKKDYDDFLEEKRRTRDIALKKIKFRNYGFGAFIFFHFIVLGIGLPILQGFNKLKDAGDWLKTSLNLSNIWEAVEGYLGEAKYYFFLICFGAIIAILAIIIIISIPKILSNNEKYKRIKYMNE
ncbi:fam-m protein [Plasmodium malariae]|uniref:Fam-m protein n=1 Tax=Plasmodium malariae TaxID=5858 RepID=A0A1D3JKI5_PLAMA|nr:fam-m protein [Plasmodium malariae]SBT87035.1 fam-m protein [Plasmodium malariae]